MRPLLDILFMRRNKLQFYFPLFLSFIQLDPEEQKGHQVPVFICARVSLQASPLSHFHFNLVEEF